MRSSGRIAVVLACVVLAQAMVPSLLHAQATLAGVVRDTSGAVLPGATVEASSPALIEKTRTALSDGTGQYRITDLPPGTYNVTFSLAGFNTVQRQDVMVSGSGVIPINAELRVGALQETVTVTGETPLVDTQSTRRETVLNAEVMAVLPATRTYGALLNTIPGLQTNTGSAGAMTTPDMTFFTAHGGRGNEGRVHIDGLPVAASFNGGGVSTFTYDVANADEMQVLVSGGLGEAEQGGPSINLVPRSGGNSFSGSAFYSTAGSWSSSNNIDDYLSSIGITKPPELISLWDVSGSVGGPIVRDRLWFFGSARQYANFTVVEGAFANAYAGDASRWDYAKDDSVESRNANSRDIYSIRLTAQLTPRSRVSFSHEYQHRCSGSLLDTSGDGCRTSESDWVGLGNFGGGTPASPESWPGYHDFPYNVTQATWNSPVSNRFLLEAGLSRFQYLWAGFGQAPPDRINLIPVTEQALRDGHPANFTYRGAFDPLGFGWADNDANPTNWRATASYVTGAHNIKFGYQGSYQKSIQGRQANESLLRYTVNNGVPNAVSYFIAPRWEQNDRTASMALFAQDQWTFGRLTVQGAVRFDRAWSWAPADHNGTTTPSPYVSGPISFDETPSVDAYNDITTRWGVAWDIFGTGKTALRANYGKYLQTASNDENYWANNPSRRIVTSIGTGGVPARGWVDGNRNFIVDCDLSNPALQDNRLSGGDQCAALGGQQLNFGSANPNSTIINPEILKGWGVRPSDWQFGVSVQQELLPRVSAEVGYYRRAFHNFYVTDNLRVGPSDFEPWTYAAPSHPDLPNGGGYPMTYYAVTREAALRGAQIYQTFETDYGPARTQYWHGMDVSLNARLRNGLTLQGGTSTGRGVRDSCAAAAQLPENLVIANVNQPLESCDVTEPWMTSIRGLVAYTIPKLDVLVSAQMRSLNSANALPGLVGSASASNGNSLNANVNVPNTEVLRLLGRLPGTTLVTQNTSVNLLTTGELYPDERVNQVDMRFAKIVRFGGTRADIGVDLYNLFNTNDTTAFQQSFDYATNGATWLNPTSIVSPRFARFNVTFSF
jgi:hypothetical protein